MNTTSTKSRLAQFRRPRRLLVWAALVSAWCALWGSFSPANLLGGGLLAFVVLASGLGPPTRGGVRLVPLARLAGLVILDLVLATWSVAVSVVSKPERVDEGIIAVPLPPSARRHLLLLICAVTVTPGTAVVDADPDTGTLYLHLLHIDDREAVARHVEELARVAELALPTPKGASA